MTRTPLALDTAYLKAIYHGVDIYYDFVAPPPPNFTLVTIFYRRWRRRWLSDFIACRHISARWLQVRARLDADLREPIYQAFAHDDYFGISSFFTPRGADTASRRDMPGSDRAFASPESVLMSPAQMPLRDGAMSYRSMLSPRLSPGCALAPSLRPPPPHAYRGLHATAGRMLPRR